MAAPPILESLQAQLAQQHTEALRTYALQHVLQVFAPEALQSPVDYLTLLDRVRTVLTEALATATGLHAAPPVTPER